MYPEADEMLGFPDLSPVK